MYLKALTLQNIKGINDLQIEFSKLSGWHVLIGDNGTGKSTILKAIALGVIGPNGVLALRQNLSNYISFGKQEGRIQLDLKHNSLPVNASIRLKKVEVETRSISEVEIEALPPDAAAYKHLWGFAGLLDPSAFCASFGPYRRFSGGNKEWEKVYESNLLIASHLSLFGEDVALTQGLEWLIQLNYKRLEQDQEATYTLESLKRLVNEGHLLPQHSKIHSVSSDGVLILDSNGQKVGVKEMSDGFRSVLSLTFELIRQMVERFGARRVFESFNGEQISIAIPGIVLIDEVDAHLHPTWQTRIGSWFTQYFPNVQFIVSTHSPLICRAAEHGSIWHLAAEAGSIHARQITGTEKDRLIYGNILEAFGTEAFGKQVERSHIGQEKLEKLAQLEALHTFKKLTKEEEEEMRQLQQTFTTDDRIDL